MTAEQLHDALTQLPSDLVAQADRRRSRNPKILRWQRFAAMAACFALVLGIGSFGLLVLTPMGGEKSEAMVEQAADEAAAAPESPAVMTPAPMAPEAELDTPAEDAGAENYKIRENELTSAPAAGSSVTSEESLARLPALTAGDLRIEAYSFQWSIPQADGTTMTMTTDVAHPTEHPDSLPRLDGDQDIIPLLWEPMPDTITAQCWPLLDPDSAVNAEAREAELTEHGLVLDSEACIYEITAHWPQGTASYAFTVTVPETIP